MPINAATSSSERQRAHDRFNSILAVHGAAMNIFEVLPSLPNGRAALAAGLRVNRGMSPAYTSDRIESYVEEVFDAVEMEKSAGYLTILSSALVSACGAFEYLLKATFVDQALLDRGEAANLLPKRKLALSASEVVAAPETEQWFLIADRLFEQLGEDQLPHTRAKVFLGKHTYLPRRAEQEQSIAEVFEKSNVEKFNEAFLIRNCVVHFGGRVNAKLAHHSGRTLGQLIPMEHKLVRELTKQLKNVANALESIWLQQQLGL